MKLIRDLLIQIEQEHKGGSIQLTDQNHAENERIQYHLKLMADAGLIDAKHVGTMDGSHNLIKGITWQGYDFLEAARSDEVWNRAEEKAEEKGSRLSELPFEVVKGLLVASTKQLFGL